MNSPSISVILTSYNHERYIREAIDSILIQTFDDFELIIWDDASSDCSWNIIQSYSDHRIRSFRSSTNKSSFAINELSMARGKYIAIHHSDDIWEPNKLEIQFRCLENNPNLAAVFSNVRVIDEAGKPFADQHHFYYDVFKQCNKSRYNWLRHFFYNGNALCHPSVLMCKKRFDECGRYRNGLYQLGDLDLWIRICLRYSIHIIEEPLVQFRVLKNNANTSSDTMDVRVRCYFEYLKIVENYLSISSVQDFVNIFPEASDYCAEGVSKEDIPFLLSMMTLGQDTPAPYKLFGLNLLFGLLSDRATEERLKNVFDFDVGNFIALTAKNDVFSIGTTAQAAHDKSLLEAATAEAVQFKGLFEVASRERQAATAEAARFKGLFEAVSREREALVSSTSWRLSSPLRKAASELSPKKRDILRRMANFARSRSP